MRNRPIRSIIAQGKVVDTQGRHMPVVEDCLGARGHIAAVLA